MKTKKFLINVLNFISKKIGYPLIKTYAQFSLKVLEPLDFTEKSFDNLKQEKLEMIKLVEQGKKIPSEKFTYKKISDYSEVEL